MHEEVEKWDAQEVAAEHHRVSSEAAINSEAAAALAEAAAGAQDNAAVEIAPEKVASTSKKRVTKKEMAAIEAAIAAQAAEPMTQMQRDLPFRKSLSDMLQTQDVARAKWVMESQQRQTELGRKAAAGK